MDYETFLPGHENSRDIAELSKTISPEKLFRNSHVVKYLYMNKGKFSREIDAEILSASIRGEYSVTASFFFPSYISVPEDSKNKWLMTKRQIGKDYVGRYGFQSDYPDVIRYYNNDSNEQHINGNCVYIRTLNLLRDKDFINLIKMLIEENILDDTVEIKNVSIVEFDNSRYANEILHSYKAPEMTWFNSHHSIKVTIDWSPPKTKEKDLLEIEPKPYNPFDEV